MSLFITDGEQRSTLAVVRALGHAGIPVTVGAEHSSCLAGHSRYCSRVVGYPPPLKEPEKFLCFIEHEMAKEPYKVLLPMTDITLQLLGSRKEALASSVGLPIPCMEKIASVQDKRQVLSLAERVGIAGPRTYLVSSPEQLPALAREVDYPVVIKARLSRLYRDGHWAFGGTLFAHDAEDLIRKYTEAQALIPDPLIQEKIEGEGRGVFILLWNGEVKAVFCHRRLREKPPWGGVSVYCESISSDPELVQKSIALLKSIGWQGVAMVEYKVDRRDGQPKLMEVNGRFWGSLQLSIDAGMNFPLMLYQLATGENPRPQFDYRIGVKSRWLLGDLDHLLIRLTHSGVRNGMPSNAPSRFRTLLSFLKFYEPRLHYEIFRSDDPKPGWYEYKTYLASNARRVFGRRGAHRAN